MDVSQRRTRIIIIAVVLCLILLIVYSVVVLNMRSGKERFIVHVIPEDATIYIDNQPAAGDLYITPGKHTISAKKSGFSDTSAVLYTSNAVNEAYLTLEPVAISAKQWASQPAIQSQYETYGSMSAQMRGMSVSEQNPILDKLPRVDISGPYSIDYGFASPDDHYKTFILVNNSTPTGRQNAFNWIRSQGYNTATLDIRYDEYISPLGENL